MCDKSTLQTRFTYERIYCCYMQTLAKSLKQEGEQARTALRVLESLTYSCVNPDNLHSLTSKVKKLIVTLKGNLPKSEGPY